MFQEREKELAQGFRELDGEFLLLRRILLQRLLARASIELPVSVIAFEAKRNDSLKEAYGACRRLQSRSIKFRLRRFFESVLRLFK
jgi:hypothetical protein